ncbi:hypothetical protein ACIGFK_01350 [Streptomyces sp. NPDC085524]|uniref:hypothetical protein n=1 Tax=Streptomyces sp. NPDC085524 TaxID=3365728 RepID=UPI0037CEECC7
MPLLHPFAEDAEEGAAQHGVTSRVRAAGAVGRSSAATMTTRCNRADQRVMSTYGIPAATAARARDRPRPGVGR